MRTFVDAVVAVDTPVVVAVVVDSAVSIEQQAVFARLQRQSAVLAFVELVAVPRVRVQLQTVGLGARADLLKSRRLGLPLRRNLATCDVKQINN